MNAQAAMPTAIPSRPTVAELAGHLGVTVEAIQPILVARDEPSAPGAVLGPETSHLVAEALGRSVVIEPRDLALETLYAQETGAGSEVQELPERARRLVEGVAGNREDLDREIEAASEHWSVARMPIIDRSILRLALYELRHEAGTPTAVIVSEAVRIAKTYSTERSGAFVNGVLASLARSSRS
jgi:transcription antitermination factor NusB